MLVRYFLITASINIVLSKIKHSEVIIVITIQVYKEYQLIATKEGTKAIMHHPIIMNFYWHIQKGGNFHYIAGY